MFKVCMKLARRLLHIFPSFFVLQGLLAAVQLRRKNWHFSAFRTLSSPCTHPSVSLTVLLWGNKGPLLTHLPHTHTSTFFLFLYITLVLSTSLFVFLPFFPASQEYLMPEKMLSESLCETDWPVSHGLWPVGLACRQRDSKHSGSEINMLLCDHPKPKSLNWVNKAQTTTLFLPAALNQSRYFFLKIFSLSNVLFSHFLSFCIGK